MYGLCDAPRVWYLSVKGVLLKASANKSRFDEPVFLLAEGWKVRGDNFLPCNDFFWGGQNIFEVSVINV